MRAVVIALGKIGLPIAVQIARHGHQVVGCDVDQRVVDLVNAAEEPFPGETGLLEGLQEVVGSGRLRASTDTTAAVAAGADIVIAVPPLVVDATAKPDFRILDSVVEAIGRGLQPGTVVVVETTLPVGTTRHRIAPRLAELSGLRSEEDFFSIHSPERVLSGRIFADLAAYPKLVGGLTDAGEARAVALYREFIPAEVRGMGGAEAAELTKLAETTYRDVNIALANEFARFADRVGIDVQRVIDAANSQPFSHIHRPGIAVGGHCIPVYPRFYLSGDPNAQLPAAARQVNESMPGYAVEQLGAALGGLRDARIAVLGVSYRGGVKETAFSGALALREALRAAGATVFGHDPLYDAAELRELGFDPWEPGAQSTPINGAIIQTDDPAYTALTPQDLPGARAVVDGRGVLHEGPWSTAGIPVIRIGQPAADPAGGERPVQEPGATSRA